CGAAARASAWSTSTCSTTSRTWWRSAAPPTRRCHRDEDGTTLAPCPGTMTPWDPQTGSLDRATLQAAYAARTLDPVAVAEAVLGRLARRRDDHVWISRFEDRVVLDHARRIAAGPKDLALYGLPFAIKDNIDVAGLDTSAACPAFAYRPAQHARVVA